MALRTEAARLMVYAAAAAAAAYAQGAQGVPGAPRWRSCWLAGRDYPAMAVVGVVRLWDERAQVELDGFAVLL